MSGTNIRLTPLAARKQLLLVESEVNRAQLLNECVSLKNQVQEWAHQAHSVVDSFMFVIAVVHEAFNTIRGAFTDHDQNKPSLISTVINGVRLGASLWSALRSSFR